MQRMRLLVVVVLLAAVFAVPEVAAAYTYPRINAWFEQDTDGTWIYSYIITNKDITPLSSFIIYAPLAAQYITAQAYDNNGVQDPSWTINVVPLGYEGGGSEITWQNTNGLPEFGTATLKILAPSWTTFNLEYTPPVLSGTNWLCSWSTSTIPSFGGGFMPVPEGVVPEPGTLASLASLGVLLAGAIKRRR